MKNSDDSGSVSYTHLDVYKRQVLAYWSKTVEILIAPVIAVVKSTPVASFIILCLIWIPVSYTHLDVYKRQIISFIRE